MSIFDTLDEVFFNYSKLAEKLKPSLIELTLNERDFGKLGRIIVEDFDCQGIERILLKKLLSNIKKHITPKEYSVLEMYVNEHLGNDGIIEKISMNGKAYLQPLKYAKVQ